jgi:hypothetical protein
MKAGGWQLVRAAWRLRRDPAAARLALALSALYGACLAAPRLIGISVGPLASSGGSWFWFSLWQFAIVFGAIFLGAAIAIAADARIEEVPLSAREAIEDARARVAPLTGWALISLVVWVGDALLARESPAAVAICLYLGWLAWSVATVLVVPAIAVFGLGLGEAIRESADCVRRRWRATLSGLLGIAYFGFLASAPAWVLAVHVSALRVQDKGEPSGIVALTLAWAAVVLGCALATKEGFALMVLRDAFEELPAAVGTARAPRGRRVLRFAGAIVAGLAIFVAVASLTRHDNRVLRAAHSIDGGLRYRVQVVDASATELPPGADVLYMNRKVGTVIDSELEGDLLSVAFVVEPEITPSSAPGVLQVIDLQDLGPTLVLVPGAGSVPDSEAEPL